MADAPLILLDSRFLLDLDEPPPQLWRELEARLGAGATAALKPLNLMLLPTVCQLSTATRLLGPSRLSPVTLTMTGSLFLRA